MILTFKGGTFSEAIAVCWERCDTAAALAADFPEVAPVAAAFIDSHFELIGRGRNSPFAPVPRNLFPERQPTVQQATFATWGPHVKDAIADVRCTNASAISRVLQKGAPHVGSVRYIGAQLYRACTEMAPQADHALLRAILRCCALGAWATRPKISPRVRYALWSESPSAQYARCAAHLKSSDVQACVSAFIQGIANMDIGTAYMLRHRNGFPNLITLTALERAVGPGPCSWPKHGFARCIDPTNRVFAELQPSATGAPPSAKRVKSVYLQFKTPELTASVRAVNHKSLQLSGTPLHAAESAHQLQTLRRVYALVCTECGTWRTRPRGGRKGGVAAGVLVDLDNSRVTCSACSSKRIYRVLVNGYQIGHRGRWGALCSACGDFGTDLHQHGTFSYCSRCHKTVSEPKATGRCKCGAPAATSHLADTDGQFTVEPTCAAHAAWAVD